MSRLKVSGRCGDLIRALKCYHYPQRQGRKVPSELPQKDGVHDHAIDALRYFFVNYHEKDKTETSLY